MTPRAQGRTESCSPADARTRLQHARKFLEVAQLIAEPGQDVEYASTAAVPVARPPVPPTAGILVGWSRGVGLRADPGHKGPGYLPLSAGYHVPAAHLSCRLPSGSPAVLAGTGPQASTAAV